MWLTEKPSGRSLVTLTRMLQVYSRYRDLPYCVSVARANDVSDGSDEEITSEEEDGGATGNKDKSRGRSTSGQVAKVEIEAKRKRKLKEYPELVAKRHKAFASFRYEGLIIFVSEDMCDYI